MFSPTRANSGKPRDFDNSILTFRKASELKILITTGFYTSFPVFHRTYDDGLISFFLNFNLLSP